MQRLADLAADIESERRHPAVGVALQMFYLPIFAAAQVDGLLEHFHALLRHEHADNARIRSAAAAPIRQKRSGRVPKISVSRPPVTIWQAIKVTKWSTFSGDFERERTTGRADQR